MSGAVRFDMRGGDAFAWSEVVRGTTSCSDTMISVNGANDVSVHTTGQNFTATIPLAPGRNEVVASCGGSSGGTDASSPLVWDERLRPGPMARIRVTVDADTVILDGGGSLAGKPDGAKIVRYTWHTDQRHPSALTVATGSQRLGTASGRRLELRAPARDGEYYVSLTVRDADGRTDTNTTYFVVRNGLPRPVNMMRQHPSWIDSAVIYAPIPQLWGNGGPRAIDHRLRYLKHLGVDALWLWPPTEERENGEPYRITDYFKLDPSWGPEPAFKRMVDHAHRLGMHVLIDFVPNHTSTAAPYYVDQTKYGRASHYYDFYDRNATGKITNYDQIFGSGGHPNLNYDNPEVRRMITQASVHWVRDLGVDGFRVDAAWAVERRRPSFWPEWRRALKRVDPDLLLLAEGSAVDPYFFSHGFDVAYDWTSHPGQWAWTSAFKFPNQTGALLAPAITNNGKGYAHDAIVLRFLNNNDTGIRFVDQYGPELTRVAAALQFTVPGIPALFAGDEIGASYEPYSNLTPIPWKDRHGLRPFYQRLIQIKHGVSSLRSHDIDVLRASPDGALVYVRPAFAGGPPVLVLLNFGHRATVSFPLTAPAGAAVGSGAVRDLLTEHRFHLTVKGNTASVAIGPRTALVLVPEGS
jgi:cyclomaltodextrinase / maltogenic alpha-amylase / neopullulanase